MLSVGPGELAVVTVVVITVGLSRWGWNDTAARNAPWPWRIVAVVPVVGTVLWLRFGRVRYR